MGQLGRQGVGRVLGVAAVASALGVVEKSRPPEGDDTCPKSTVRLGLGRVPYTLLGAGASQVSAFLHATRRSAAGDPGLRTPCLDPGSTPRERKRRLQEYAAALRRVL